MKVWCAPATRSDPAEHDAKDAVKAICEIVHGPEVRDDATINDQSRSAERYANSEDLNEKMLNGSVETPSVLPTLVYILKGSLPGAMRRVCRAVKSARWRTGQIRGMIIDE